MRELKGPAGERGARGRGAQGETSRKKKAWFPRRPITGGDGRTCGGTKPRAVRHGARVRPGRSSRAPAHGARVRRRPASRQDDALHAAVAVHTTLAAARSGPHVPPATPAAAHLMSGRPDRADRGRRRPQTGRSTPHPLRRYPRPAAAHFTPAECDAGERPGGESKRRRSCSPTSAPRLRCSLRGARPRPLAHRRACPGPEERPGRGCPVWLYSTGFPFFHCPS